MKVTESYEKYTVEGCHDTINQVSCVTRFLNFLQLIIQFLFDQLKERENSFGFITKTYFIFVDLCF